MTEVLRIFDADGGERDELWLTSEFGAVEVVKRQGSGGYYAAELRDSGEPAATSLVVTVLGSNGERLPGIRVAFYWPDAPEDAGAGWMGRCVVGITDGGGAVGFGMGGGAYYWPPDKGPHAVWVYGPDMSDMVDGLGMIGGTNHRHLDVTFQIPDETEPPPPPPPPPEPEPEGDLRYYDEAGTQRDAAWALAMFGTQDIHQPDACPVHRLVELREQSGDTRIFRATVLDAEGKGLSGVEVAIGPRDIQAPKMSSITGADGVALFPMDDTFKYYVPGQGHYVCAVLDGSSDVYNSVGWVAREDRWLNATFRLAVDPEEPPIPPPEPPPGPTLDDALALVDDLRAMLVEMME